MKYLVVILFFLLNTSLMAQHTYKSLNEVGSNDTIENGQAIIYGNFIQRLGFTSGGFPQDIRVINVNTNEIVTFRVKPTFKSAKENTFCYKIPPGTYAIYNYWWTQSKWYGGKVFTESICKNVDASDSFAAKIKAGQINPDTLKPYTFTIESNSINYLGDWHFNTGLVSFSDNKPSFDAIIRNSYKKLDLTKAKTVLPN